MASAWMEKKDEGGNIRKAKHYHEGMAQNT